MVTRTTERDSSLGRISRSLANAVSVATLCALAWPTQAATIIFPRGTVDVKLEVEGQSCNDGSALICITTLATQRAYLLKVPGGNAEFVAEAYRVLLRRAPQPAYLTYYVGILNAGTATRERVIEVLVDSAEYRALP